MAAISNFYKSTSPDEWRRVLELYQKAISMKAEKKTKPKDKKELLLLDKWYKEELTATLQSREDKHITYDEICKLMTWKLMRGKFRPTLTKLIQSNSAELVEKSSRTAFKKMPNIDAAIKALTVLRGVGPATASAVLAAGSPENAAFMADEALMAIPGCYPTDYSLKSYIHFDQMIKQCVNRLNREDAKGDWTPHTVEQTLWTYKILHQLKPTLLEGIKENPRKRPSSGSPPSKRKKTK